MTRRNSSQEIGALAQDARAEPHPSRLDQPLDRIGRRRRDELDRERQIGVRLVLAELQAIGPDLDLGVRRDDRALDRNLVDPQDAVADRLEHDLGRRGPTSSA